MKMIGGKNCWGMTRVIRHKATRAFFTAGNWTKDFGAAQKFSDLESVLEAREKYQIKGAEVVLLMEAKPSQYDVILPLQLDVRDDEMKIPNLKIQVSKKSQTEKSQKGKPRSDTN